VHAEAPVTLVQPVAIADDPHERAYCVYPASLVMTVRQAVQPVVVVTALDEAEKGLPHPLFEVLVEPHT